MANTLVESSRDAHQIGQYFMDMNLFVNVEDPGCFSFRSGGVLYRFEDKGGEISVDNRDLSLAEKDADTLLQFFGEFKCAMERHLEESGGSLSLSLSSVAHSCAHA